MRKRQRAALRELLPNNWNSYGYQENVTQTLRKTLNEWTLVGRVARIIAKHMDFICVLRKSKSNHRKPINEYMLVGLVTIIIAKQKEFIGSLRKCQPNNKKTNKNVNDSGAQRENHCLTQRIHKFTAKMLPNP